MWDNHGNIKCTLIWFTWKVALYYLTQTIFAQVMLILLEDLQEPVGIRIFYTLSLYTACYGSSGKHRYCGNNQSPSEVMQIYASSNIICHFRIDLTKQCLLRTVLIESVRSILIYLAIEEWPWPWLGMELSSRSCPHQRGVCHRDMFVPVTPSQQVRKSATQVIRHWEMSWHHRWTGVNIGWEDEEGVSTGWNIMVVAEMWADRKCMMAPDIHLPNYPWLQHVVLHLCNI